MRQIGIAEADFYPAISINGTLGYSAQQFPDLFRSDGPERQASARRSSGTC